jgi:uncharacterized membrane protein
MRRADNRLIAVLALLALAWPAGAAPLTYGPAELMRLGAGNKKNLNEVTDDRAPFGRALEAVGPFRLEAFGLQRVLQPGWHRLTLRVRMETPPGPADNLAFAFWCPNKVRNPDTFRYETTFAAAEFAAPGRYGELSRVLYLGPSFGNYGLSLHGFKGLRVGSLTLEPIGRSLTLEQVQANKILYGLREPGTVTVRVLNASGKPQTGRLSVAVESGLDDTVTLLDREVSFPGASPGKPDVVEVPLPPQPEYGHAVVATLRQGDTVIGTARDYFYTTDRPAQVGHLGDMGIDAAYGVGNAPEFVDHLRRHCFPMYEIIFWAPDDVLELLPPPGKDRWWSGQTLAQMTTDSLKERIRLGQSQGMKVLAYTNLRYDFGFRVAESFRHRPEFCEWDANNNDLAYAINAVRRQERGDDAERFDPSAPNKPKFKAQGVWRMAAGNPELVDAHIDQLVRSTKYFGWDGWRYDDRYDYDEPAVDLLGRQLPKGGWRNPSIVARVRAAMEKAKPGIIYGHNLEWAQDQPARADEPMPLDTPPHANDYYTEFLRDGGLHLQERWLAQMIGRHAPWTAVRDNLLALGHNAYRRGGYAYGLSYVQRARPTDARHLVALHFAGLDHLAGGVDEANLGQMRLACRHADLLYGDKLVPLLDGEKVLHVDAGGKPVWWQRYVRYREVAPGRRVYLVHLINPPRGAKIGEGDPNPPEPVRNIALAWKLPPGWKATRAFQLSGEGDTAVETVVSAGGAWAQLRKDLVGFGLFRKELPVRNGDGVGQMVVPELGIWSVVAVDCKGPADDVAPDVRFPLPPLPADVAPGKWEDAKGYSPQRTVLTYDAEDPKGWTRPDPETRGKRIPLETVPDPAATGGRAARCVEGWELTAYRPGEAVQDGLYRFSFRVRTTAKPPADARLQFSAWCPPKRTPAWRVNESVSLDGLTTEKGWQTVTHEVELGYAWENFALQVRGGFDGLLIDHIKVEEVRRQPDSVRLKRRNLAGWPAGPTLTPHEGVRVWLGDGLYAERYRFDEALRSIPGVTVARAEHWTYRDKRGFNVAGWAKAEDLAGYDLVILSNVDLKTLTLEQRDWLRGYVVAGGSLLMTGGPYGLGRGGWQESDLIEPLLPVKLHDYDLRPGDIPLPLALAEGGFLTEKWPDRPVTLWLHEVEPKPGAVVQLKAGDKPALITGTAGKGRVAVLTLTPLGEMPAGGLGWWQWPGWDNLLAKTAQWLLKKG